MRTKLIGSILAIALAGLALSRCHANGHYCADDRVSYSESPAETVDTGAAMAAGSGGNSSASSVNFGNVEASPASIALPITIEESDLVQIEGDTLYVHNVHNGLSLIDIEAASQPRLRGQVAETAGKAGELYVRGDYAVVVLGEEGDGCTLPLELGGSTVTERHRIATVATDDAPVFLTDLCLPGHVVANRLVGNALYVVSSFEKFGEVTSWLIGVDVTDVTAPHVTKVLALDQRAHEVHVTERAIYLAQELTADGEVVNQATTPTTSGGSQTPPEQASTRIRYFDLSQGPAALAELGSIDLAGAPQGRFHLDEWGDTFRVVTFSGRDQGSNLYVLDVSHPKTITVQGQLLGLAAGEDLHATRFAGDQVYVVTYEAVILRTDPLWVIDLSEPSAPRVRGRLEIPGFSNFIYPRGDTLLAVGRGDSGNRVAVSLFDVSDPADPRELRRLELGNDNSFSEANLDFRGVTVIENAFGAPSLIALPITEQHEIGDGTCQHTSQLHLIDLRAADLVVRGTASFESMIQRTLPVDNRLYVVGTLHLGSYDVSQRDAPVLETELVLGNLDLPVECIAFVDVLGNSPDAQVSTAWGGLGDDVFQPDWVEGDGVGYDTADSTARSRDCK